MLAASSDDDDMFGEPLIDENEHRIVFDSSKARIFPQVLATLVVCLAPLSMGLTLGFSATTTINLQHEGILTNADEVSWYGSLITVGAIVGGPIAGVISEKLGRKTTIIFCCLAFSNGWLMIVAAKGYVLLFCGRVVTGLGMGMCSLVTPMYIAEISTKELRGMLGSTFQLFVTIGILAVYGLGMVVHRKWLGIACSSVSVLLSLCILPLPETPRWLISTRQREKGMQALRWLRGMNVDIEEECCEIEANLASRRNTVTIKDLCCMRSLSRPLSISIGLMFFQQASGINVFIFYTADIFQKAGFEDNPHIPTVIVGAIQVVSTFIACIVMDLAGRRLLLIGAAVVMTLSTGTFGLYYYLTMAMDYTNLSWLSLTSLIVFIIAFSLGWGPIPWLMMSEIFPVQARGLASSIATLCNWTFAFLMTSQYHRLQTVVHPYGAMWIFSGVMILAVLFVAILVPETKGKTLEEIQENFEEDQRA